MEPYETGVNFLSPPTVGPPSDISPLVDKRVGKVGTSESVLGTIGDAVTHETPKLAAKVFDFHPVPSPALTAKVLLIIWEVWSFLRARKKEVPCMPCSAVQLKPCTSFLRGNFHFPRAFLVAFRAAVIKFP